MPPDPGPREIDFDFSYAFQPIVNARRREIVAFEALVRGPEGQPAAAILAKVSDRNAFLFEQASRLKAIQLATSLRLRKRLNLNLYPLDIEHIGLNIRSTMDMAVKYHFPQEDINLEVTEYYQLAGHSQLIELIRLYHDFGFHIAIDDFGTGYAGLSLLIEYQPNYVKLARFLIQDIHQDPIRQTIAEAIRLICERLQIQMIAEGVEKAEEYEWLLRAGVNIFQGYYFAPPVFETLPDVRSEVYRV